jgi:hypothetical protein
MNQVRRIPHQRKPALVQVGGFTEEVAGIPERRRRDVESVKPPRMQFRAHPHGRGAALCRATPIPGTKKAASLRLGCFLQD